MTDEELEQGMTEETTEQPEEIPKEETPKEGTPEEENPGTAETPEKEGGEGAQIAEMKEQLLRTMAEYDNFRKRTAREKEALRADIITNVTSKFLPVMDNLERALTAECSDENYKNGVKMIYDSFMETLKNLGVEEIVSDGEPFDPNIHQAVQRVENSEQKSGTVVQTFAKGYRIGDKVIRFAMVAVAN